jgi:hypothetical protein
MYTDLRPRSNAERRSEIKKAATPATENYFPKINERNDSITNVGSHPRLDLVVPPNLAQRAVLEIQETFSTSGRGRKMLLISPFID